jgi:HEAT repeat protein
MTNTTDPTSDSVSQHQLSDDLPPVQPPSAGFIIQLFVVPGLIVLAVVAVWFAFGRIAAYDQDWKPLAGDLQSPNDKIRDRAMYGLAELLARDSRRGEAGQHLASNVEIAQALTDKLAKELKTGSTSEESVGLQVYLTRAVGYLDTADLALPVLRQAIEPTRDVEVRKGGALSIAMIAGRAFEAGQPLEDPETVDALIELSADSQPLMRQTAAFALAFFQSEQADQQLHVLLGNSNQATSVNAAIALARRKNTDGLGVFKQALMAPAPTKREEAFEHFTILTNTLKAIANLAPHMSEPDRAEFREVLKPLTTDHAEIRIRVDAQNALQSLK